MKRREREEQKKERERERERRINFQTDGLALRQTKERSRQRWQAMDNFSVTVHFQWSFFDLTVTIN